MADDVHQELGTEGLRTQGGPIRPDLDSPQNSKLHPPDQPAGLAGAAEICDLSSSRNLRNVPSAARADLAAPHMHREKVAGF